MNAKISTLLGARFKQGLGLSRRRNRSRPREPLVFEPLENRAVPAIGFSSAFGLGASSLSLGRIAVDAAGDSYVTGSFTGAVNFNPFGNTTLSVARTTGFVAKYSITNQLLWVQDFPADSVAPDSTSAVTAVAIDYATQVVYVAGTFDDVIDAPSNGTPHVLIGVFAQNGFVAGLSFGSGTLAPGIERVLGGTCDPTDLQVSANGSTVYVTGGFTGAVDFDYSGNDPLVLDSPNGGAGAFLLVLGLSERGNVAAVGQLATQGTNLAIAGASGLVYVGTTDGYVAQFDASGNFIGMTQVGTGNTLVAADSAGNVWTDTNVTKESILTELDASFAVVWQRVLTSPSAVVADDLAIDGNDNLYLSGLQVGQSSYGAPGDFATVILNTPSNVFASFVLEVNSEGNPLQVIGSSTTGSGDSGASEIGQNGSGTVVIDGLYSSPVSFGNTSLGLVGAQEAFVATLTSTMPPAALFIVPLTPPPPPPSAPVFLGEHRMTLKVKRKSVVEFVLSFNASLGSSAASYTVTQPGRTKKSAPRSIRVVSATLKPPGTSITLILGAYAKKKPLTLKATGLAGADGIAVAAVMTGL